jgi:hypothetical protein
MNTTQIARIAVLTLAALAALTLTGQAEARNHSNIIVTRPGDLPELAREPGQAMLLHETGDGRTLLYIEQDHGARLAIFDVTDPAKVKQETAARLDAQDSFDFVSALGDNAELVRFRNGQADAVLNLHKVDVPTLNTIQGLDLQGSTERLGDDGFTVADQPSGHFDAKDPNYEIVDTSNPLQPQTVVDVKQVREQITNDETGTTYLLTAEGLYLIRRPAVEEEHQIHEWQMLPN